MTSKSLQDAVLDVAVRNFTFPPKAFSAYDITKLLRADVNNKLYEITEFVGTPSKHGQEVYHTAVRDVVASLHTTKHFDRSYNGTFFVYTIGTIPLALAASQVPTPKWDPITDSVYQRVLAIIANQTAITVTQIKPTDSLVTMLGYDDLDFVETIMALEDEFSKELGGDEIPEPTTKVNTVKDLYNVVAAELEKRKNKPVAAVVVVPPTPKPAKEVLKMYIKGRFDEGITPSLKNAQKALKRKGTSVREVSDIAKALGYNVLGNQSIPFGEWVIARK